MIKSQRLSLPCRKPYALTPDEAQAHVLLADIYRRNGDIQKCNQELKLVFANPNLDAEPKIRVITGYLTMLKTDQELEDALVLVKQLADTHPNEPKTSVIYADLLMRRGKKRKPVIYMQKRHGWMVLFMKFGVRLFSLMVN